MALDKLALAVVWGLCSLSIGCGGDDSMEPTGGAGASRTSGASGGAGGSGGGGMPAAGASGAGGGGAGGSGASGAGGGGAGSGGGAGGAAPAGCESCADACVVVHVSADVDSAEAAWALFPGEAVGRGRLFVGVFQSGSGAVVETVDDVDLVAGFDARDVVLCAPAAALRAFCFLDDQGDGMVLDPAPTLLGSTNYIDTCPRSRSLMTQMTAPGVGELDCTLEVSCD